MSRNTQVGKTDRWQEETFFLKFTKFLDFLHPSPPFSTQRMVLQTRFDMNIYPPSFHGLPAKVCLKWSKSPPWMALIFMRILDQFFDFRKHFFQSSVRLLSINSRMDQVKEVKAVCSAVLNTSCLIARLYINWSKKPARWLILMHSKTRQIYIKKYKLLLPNQ